MPAFHRVYIYKFFLGTLFLTLLLTLRTSPAISAEAENLQSAEAALENPEAEDIELNLYFLVEAAAQEAQIIATLKRMEEVPESLWVKIFRLARQPSNADLRVYLFERFSDSLPGGGFMPLLDAAFFEVVTAELDLQLRKGHHSREQLQRILAALGLVEKWSIRSAFYQCISFIAYPISDIRGGAYGALASIGDDRMFPLILELAASQNPVERAYALDALFYIQDERVMPILITLLRDENKSVRYYALRTLEEMNDPETYYYFIKAALSDDNDEVRVRAIEALGRIKPKGAYTVLNQTVFDDNDEVRNASIDALILFNYTSAAISLSDQLYLEENRELKLKLIKALLSVGDAGKMRGLNRVMKEESDTEILIWAVYVSGQLKDARGVRNVSELLKHPHEDVRTEAALALAVYRDESPVGDLLELLHDEREKYQVQSAALHALFMIDEDRSIPELFTISENHANPYIRLQAKEVVGGMLNSRY